MLGRLLEQPWHAALIAVLVAVVDMYSVFAGPTKEIVEERPGVLDAVGVAFAAPGYEQAAVIGTTDFIFLGLLGGAALRYDLRPRLTLPLLALSFSVTLLLDVPARARAPRAAAPVRGLPAAEPRPRPAAPWLIARRRAPTPSATPPRPGERERRWTPARDALWQLLERHVPAGASVAVCGAGNCDDLPLRRLAGHAGRVDLLDLDPASCRAAVRRVGRADRARVRVLEVDASEGLADRVVATAGRGEPVLPPPAADLQRVAAAPLGEPPYDVVVGDLLYSQLLFPGLRDLELDGERIDDILRAAGQALTDAVVHRLVAAAPGGRTIHVDDPLAWWRGHDQPFGLDDVLAAADRSVGEALELVATRPAPHRHRPPPGAGGAHRRDGALALAVRGGRRLPGLRVRRDLIGRRPTSTRHAPQRGVRLPRPRAQPGRTSPWKATRWSIASRSAGEVASGVVTADGRAVGG